MNEPRGSFWRRLGCGEEWCGRSLLGADSSPFPQYSQKEDKYEEEIKILTDKLKEVSWGDLGGRHLLRQMLVVLWRTPKLLR